MKLLFNIHSVSNNKNIITKYIFVLDTRVSDIFLLLDIPFSFYYNP